MPIIWTKYIGYPINVKSEFHISWQFYISY
jgi:hypothetical protein